MVADSIDAAEIVEKLGSQQFFILDVRSEKEYTKAHFPCSINIPILCNEHRHEVGLTYKSLGQQKAIELGNSLVAPLKSSLLDQWISSAEKASLKNQNPVICCWRGGLRSQITQEWLLEQGISIPIVSGGYKALRNHAMKLIDAYAHYDMWVLCGKTGCGKTELLDTFEQQFNSDLNILNLEKLAQHRGSAFGAFQHLQQPSQSSFENFLAISLLRGAGRQILVEDESRNIGRCYLPSNLYKRMGEANLIELDDTLENRVRRIYEGYVAEPLQMLCDPVRLHDSLQRNLEKIRKRLGSELFLKILALLSNAFFDPWDQEGHIPWIKTLLTDYYDRLYHHHRSKGLPRPVLFRGNYDEVFEFLIHIRSKGNELL